jgi:hypothetical protein
MSTEEEINGIKVSIMSNVTESIFDNGSILIPMADVSHVEHLVHPTIGANGIMVITKHTQWNMEADTWANAAFIPEAKKQDFIKAFCIYRSEIEKL